MSILIFCMCTYWLSFAAYLIRGHHPSIVIFHWLYYFIKASNYTSSVSRPTTETVEHNTINIAMKNIGHNKYLNSRKMQYTLCAVSYKSFSAFWSQRRTRWPVENNSLFFWNRIENGNKKALERGIIPQPIQKSWKQMMWKCTQFWDPILYKINKY